jgi:hypothetical protein
MNNSNINDVLNGIDNSPISFEEICSELEEGVACEISNSMQPKEASPAAFSNEEVAKQQMLMRQRILNVGR